MNDLGNIAEMIIIMIIYMMLKSIYCSRLYRYHTIVFAQWREEEFIMKLQGYSYEEIAKKVVVLNSAKKFTNNPEEELFDAALKRINEVINWRNSSFRDQKWLWAFRK